MRELSNHANLQKKQRIFSEKFPQKFSQKFPQKTYRLLTGFVIFVCGCRAQ